MLRADQQFATFGEVMAAAMAAANPRAAAARSNLASAWAARKRAQDLQRSEESAYIRHHSAYVKRTDRAVLIYSAATLKFRVAEERVKLLHEILGKQDRE